MGEKNGLTPTLNALDAGRSWLGSFTGVIH
jgi:hypothetical protein